MTTEPEKPETKFIGAHATPDLYDRLKRSAGLDRRHLAPQILVLLEEALDKRGIKSVKAAR